VDRHWIATVTGVVAIVLVLGMLLGTLIAPGTIAQAFGWLRPIWNTLMQLLMMLIYILAYLFFGLFEPLLENIRPRASEQGPRPFESPLEPVNLEELARNPVEIPPIFGQIVQTMLVVGGIALVVWFFVRAVRKRKQEATLQDEVFETRETILTLDLIRDQMQGLFDGLRGSRSPPVFVEPGERGDPRRTIRELYQAVLARGIANKAPREREQTPARYEQSLGYIYSGQQADAKDERQAFVKRAIAALTRAYEGARYGRQPPTLEQVQAAQEAFAQLGEEHASEDEGRGLLGA
jgi:hypothetical protein